MGPIQTLRSALIASLVLAASARHAPVHQVHHHKHQAIEVGKRQAYPPYMHRPSKHPAATTSSAVALTYITPSPGASPVAVTKQSQIVGSFVPEFTLCELPPLAFYPISRHPVPTGISAAPYRNYSVSTGSGNGTCTTIYSPTITMVCATTLTALATKYTVTGCAQDVTFSTQYGYVLVTPTPTPVASIVSVINTTAPFWLGPNGTGSGIGPVVNSTLPKGTRLVRRAPSASALPAMITPGPSIATLTTYYLAPWWQLTAGTAPSEVDLKVCRTFTQNDNTECIREYQVWSTSLVTKSATSITSVNISTTIHGRSQIIVETFKANVTELLTTFSLSTTMDLEYQTELTTTHSATRAPSTSTGPTVYETLTVEHPSQTAMPTSDDSTTTSTTTIHSTSTVYAGTTTVTMASGQLPPTAAPTTASADFASMLGFGARWLRERLV